LAIINKCLKMKILSNKLKLVRENLQNGRATIGSWMQLPDTSVAEIMGKAGYEWVAVDLEHGRFSQQILPDVFRALELGGTLPFARVARSEATEIKKALDAGALGIILPMIESAQQLEEAVKTALYPPKGTRGVGYCRANLFGKNFDEYSEKIAQNVILIAQIEHLRAVEALDEILSVAGLDGIIVGPYDLSASMGLTAQFEHEDFLDAMYKIQEKTSEYKIPMGLHIVQPNPIELQQKIDEGYQFIAYSIDAVFLYNVSQSPTINEK
jgi:2-dehydro-3-deoxyglucarate aldolase